ncbi:fimbria/pilus outer membrane usher protein [Carnimonas bestiolae]|uniref:fimbria/pilus outer membrane usher protein n=1 Tax=Carnimonas bestiolae TaxID=3402172 RepID=UPI003EDCAF4C
MKQSSIARTDLRSRARWLALGLLGGSAIFPSLPVQAEEKFNASFLRAGSGQSALEAVQHGDDILPGTYPFSLYLNGEEVERAGITFVRNAAEEVVPCLTPSRLRELGIRLPNETPQEPECAALETLLPDARTSFDVTQQRVDLSVPQIHLDRLPRGAVPHWLWDEGVTAGVLDYSLTATRNEYDGLPHQDYYYLGLNSGFNLGAWRYRNRAVARRYTGNGSHWQTLGNSLERDVIGWRSRLQLGDAYSRNDVFDSIRFRGVQLSSDDEQLAFSMQQYSPVIRGVASTNARVEVTQNNLVIYSINVAPGPFEINDLSPSSLSGDLLVNVIEADGSVHSFTQAYSAVPNMLRDGIWRYQLTAGEFRNGGSLDDYHPSFLQLTASRGLSNDTTPYAGLLIAEHYRAASVGIGKGLGQWGAVSLDVTGAITDIAAGDQASGISSRFLYSKSLNSWGSEFRLLGYRYSTSRYYDFADAAAERAQWQQGHYQYEYDDNQAQGLIGVPDWSDQRRRYAQSGSFYNKRSQWQMSLTQQVWNSDQLYANWNAQSYWHGGHSQRSWQVGYNGRAAAYNYSLYYQYSTGRFTSSERTIGMSISLPLGSSSSSPMYANAYASHSNISGNSIQSGLSGSALSDNRLSYNASAGHNGGGGNSAAVSGSYQGAVGSANAGYTYGNHYRQTSLGVSGGAVVHSGGVTLGQALQTTMVLVDAKEAQGVGIENQQGITVNRSGYALVSGSAPYRRSRVALKAEDIGANLEVTNTSTEVVPTRGAVVRAYFDTHAGRSVLIDGHLADGTPLPLGAAVYAMDGREQGIVGPDGQAFVTGIEEGQRLTVRWGEANHQQCELRVVGLSPDSESSLGYDRLAVQCQADSEIRHE